MLKKEKSVKIKKTDERARLPEYAHPGDSGADVFACIDSPVRIYPRCRELVSTGLSVSLPDGYELQVRPKSGLAAKYGLTVANSPGTVDNSYTGTVMVCLLNTSDDSVLITPGQKIAQIVVVPVEQFNFVEVNELPSTDRGSGGFGSTGV